MIPFEKWHGAGNDFIVIDHAVVRGTDLRSLAIRECNRDSGIGSDGVLILNLIEGTPPHVQMTLYQPDGRTAEMCGNGARIAAKWTANRSDSMEVVVDAPAGQFEAHVDGDEVTVEMGTPSFTPDDIPLEPSRTDPLIDELIEGLVISVVNTGVPHAVGFVDNVNQIDLAEIGPQIRHADLFPEGVNVTIAGGDSDTGGFDQRTFERGVEGETVACGTGAVAIGAVAWYNGLIESNEPITISPPGGELSVTIRPDGSAQLRGPVSYEFSGELECLPA